MDARFWQRAWEEDFDRRQADNKREATVDYWDKRAFDFSAMRRSHNYSYGRAVYEALAHLLQPQSAVLDIGAGPGSLLIPFCERGHRVRALEPSTVMLEQLAANAAEASVTNYDTVAALWQDYEEGGEPYDLVMVSLVLWMFRDPWPEILRMERHAAKHCAIIADIPDPHNRRTASAVDINEFQIFYNMLLANGRFPEVRLINYRCERTVEEELQCQRLMHEQYKGPVDDEIMAQLRQKVESMAEDGQCLIESRSAIIQWSKDEKSNKWRQMSS